MTLRIAFRTDASIQIGTGHVMRCLTVADALRAKGARCHFISRAHPGHLMEVIRQRGHVANRLVATAKNEQVAINNSPTTVPNLQIDPPHAAWLGGTWEADAMDTAAILVNLQPDWLVVDHYALDQRWESALQPYYKKLMVIDDLADRAHSCDLLLDQNWFGDDTPTRYRNLVPLHCKCHLGPKYALLKPEYAQLRESMPLRDGTVRRILVFLGGSDPTNQTSKVLDALIKPSFAHLQVDVVVGQNHPNIEGIAAQAAARSGTTLHQSLPTLAHLMSRADLMISGGGSTTWERMSLGLPAIVISVAANQTSTNVALMSAGYINFLGEMREVSASNIADAVKRSLANPADLKAQSSLGQKLVTGFGVQIIYKQLLKDRGAQDVT
jgi:UDP-2,4-diacetamido-2,4,6-trideoxy-beta-L-altropyranose hydrolase